MQNAYFSRIVRHFTTLFGAQKVAATFGGTIDDQKAASEAWEAQLRATDPEVIRKALQSLTQNPPAWPPGSV
jgi:ATP-dependent protease HslVU (ClpYQ) peptidase subunit